MNHPEDLRYSASHEWVRMEGDIAAIGITDYAQNELGDIVYLELPEVGRSLVQEGALGVVESVKAVSDLFAPVAGEVVEVSEELVNEPERINAAPYEAGWMIKVRVADPASVDALLDAAAYEASIGNH